jgi:hypothetical protein
MPGIYEATLASRLHLLAAGALCSVLLCFSAASRAEELAAATVPAVTDAAVPALPEPTPASEPATQAGKPPAQRLSDLLKPADEPRNYWSDKFVAFANDIDRFFGDPRYFQETNKSVLQLNLSKVYEPGGGGSAVLDGQAKLDLPSTKKRFSLMLESNPEKNISGEVAKRPVLANEVVTSNNQSAAVRVERPPQDSPWYFSADVGVKAHIPLEPFVRSRASYSKPWENWRMKIAETVFWFASIGAGETTQIDFERFISEPVLFRATSTATWLNDPHNFDLRQDLSLYYTLSDRTALLYQASVIGVSQPQLEATEYVLLLVARYRVHRSWVFFEVSPQLHFPKLKNFDSSPMLLVRLEVLFDGSR